jgi:hypothetical protein
MHAPTGRLLLAAVLVATACGVAACGVASPREQTAISVANGLLAAGIPVDSLAWCAPNSPGAPPDASVLSFHDRRLPGPRQPRRVADGGVVEVLGTADLAAARERQLAQQVLVAGEFGYDEGGQPLATGPVFVSGPVVLRVSGQLPDSQAAGYRSALARPAGDATDSLPTVPCLS